MLFKYFTRDAQGLPVDGMDSRTRYQQVIAAGRMFYCESGHHCRQWPCPDSRTNFQKQHDKRLELQPLPGYVYLVQYRHPLESLVSYYSWTLKNRPTSLPEAGNSERNWLAFLGLANSQNIPEQLAYWRGFVSKWVLSSMTYPRLSVSYSALVDQPEEQLADVVRFMTQTKTPDRALIRAIVKNMSVRRRRAIEDFRFYDRRYFSQLESLVAPELDALGIPRYF
jgi:hypothetical protein